MLLVLNLPAQDLLDSLRQPNRFYVGQRQPLAQSPFQKLPVGSVRPRGWLLKQLENQADGFSGRLSEISAFLRPEDNAWLHPNSGKSNGWEEVPYWLRGQISLGYVLGDRKIESEAETWIQAALRSRRPDGWFGPSSNLDYQDGKPDLWPNMLMLYALRTYYEHSKDRRVLDLMSAYFHWELSLPDSDFLYKKTYWQWQRGADNLSSVLWLYNRTGESSLLELAKKIYRHTVDWKSGVANHHGVNVAQAFRGPATFYQVSHDPADLEATEHDYEVMRAEFGQVPGGMYGADENARAGYSDPRQGTETCAMVEMMLSDEDLMTTTADPKWGDRAEDVAFNSLPAAMTADEKALRYLTCPNMPESDRRSKNPEIENSGPMFAMDPHDHRCCQHNVSMGWPYFVEHMWLATNDDGLAVALYGPSNVTAKVGSGATASIRETTEYPFSDRLRFDVSLDKPARFPLLLRLPSWCREPKVQVNGSVIKPKVAAGFMILNRSWRTADSVSVSLPMTIEVHQWQAQKGAVSVSRGPLSYSLKIRERYVRSGGSDAWPAYEILPGSPWNFGLPQNPTFKVVHRPMPVNGQPFAVDSVPILLEAEGRAIPGWKLDSVGLAGLLQPSPAETESPLQNLELIPMGAAHLRITVFPIVTSAGGHEWH